MNTPTVGPVEVVYNEEIRNPYFIVTKASNGADVVLAILPELTDGELRTGRHGGTISGESKELADLIAAAFNIVAEVQAMGFDPISAVEALPGLLKHGEIVDRVFCPINPNKLRAATQEVKAVAIGFRASLAAARERRGG